MRIENWELVEYDDKRIVFGNVYGNPLFADGVYVRTSLIMELDENMKWARTMNSFYELGKRLESYEFDNDTM